MKLKTLCWAVTPALLLAAHPAGAASTLSLYFNNDGESELLPEGNVGGIARYVGTLNALRSADPNHILTVSAGDNILPGPQLDAGYQDEALAAVGYNAIGIGNHEFDLGPAFLAGFIEEYGAAAGTARAPWISANLDFSGEASLQDLVDSGAVAKRTIVEVGGARYGIIGATTRNLGFISSAGNVIASDPLGPVQAEIDDLVNNQGVNRIIVVSHGQDVSADRDLAANLRGVDVMVSGGGNNLLANPGTPINPGDSIAGPFPEGVTDADGRDVVLVSTAGGYEYIGKLEVTFDDATNEVTSSSGGPVRINSVDGSVVSDPTVLADIQSPTAAYVDAAMNEVASTEVRLDARADVVRSREAVLGNVIADAVRETAEALVDAGVSGVNSTLPLLGIMNGGGIRTDAIVAQPGDAVTELDVRQILPFSNELSVVTNVSTRQLASFLENAVSRIVVDPDGGLRREGEGTGRFAQVSGFSFAYDPARPALQLAGDPQSPGATGTARTYDVLTAGERLRSVVLDDGTVLVEDGEVVLDTQLNLAMLSFSADGGDQYFYDFQQEVVDLGIGDAELFQNYLQNLLGLGGGITAFEYGTLGNRIQAVPVPAALPLLGSALVGLLALGRRRRA